MGKVLEEFLAYLKNSSEEKLQKDWAEIKAKENKGPTMTSFLEECHHCNEILSDTSPWELNISNKLPKSEEFFGFFLF